MFDMAILGGTLIDPEKNQLTVANLYCDKGKIVEISRERREAETVIDASGLCVSPGFIDIHAHVDGKAPAGELLCLQGVTTVVGGNCGSGILGVGYFLLGQNENGFVINQLQLVGTTDLRRIAGQEDPYAPLGKEGIAKAREILEQELADGGAGLSFGLEYTPGSSREEVMALSEVAARYGKPVAIHIRTDCYAGLRALLEAIDICRETGAGVQISHVVYQFGFGMMRQALEIIDNAVSEGLDITCDSGMYTSFATYAGSAVYDDGCLEKWGCGYGDLLAASGRYAGRNLTEDMFFELRRESPDDVVIALIGNESEIAEAFELPYMMVSSDAGVGDEAGHPQDAGTFPRFFRKMVRELGNLTLPDAVRRVTLLPARRMGLDSKGRLTPGCDADLVVFDPNKIRDNSHFPHVGRPDTPPDGVEAVVVNGKTSVRHGQISGIKSGVAIIRPNEQWIYK
jgi:N-acyl-D-amino-acid deacylase